MGAHQGEQRSDLKIGLAGLGIGVALILVIGGFAFWVGL